MLNAQGRSAVTGIHGTVTMSDSGKVLLLAVLCGGIGLVLIGVVIFVVLRRRTKPQVRRKISWMQYRKYDIDEHEDDDHDDASSVVTDPQHETASPGSVLQPQATNTAWDTDLDQLPPLAPASDSEVVRRDPVQLFKDSHLGSCPVSSPKASAGRPPVRLSPRQHALLLPTAIPCLDDDPNYVGSPTYCFADDRSPVKLHEEVLVMESVNHDTQDGVNTTGPPVAVLSLQALMKQP